MPRFHAQAEIADIDAEIFALEAKLLDLRRRRNALIPFSSIPSELINKIFTFVVNDAIAVAQHSINEDFNNTNPLEVFSWLPITHCCVRWRKAALDCSTLWTHIWTTNLGLFKAFIQRSHQQPLHVDTWSGRIRDTEYSEMFRLVATNLHRVRSLHMRPRYTRERLLWLRNIPAPQLEVLRYSHTGLDPIRIPTQPVQPYVMPKLRRLQMVECSRDEWDPLLPLCLPAVTDIILEDIHPNDELNILNRCQAVRRLSLTGGWADLTQPMSIALMDLQCFKFSDSHWSLFNHMAFPSVRDMHIDIAIAPHSMGDANLAISRLIQGMSFVNISASNPPHHLSATYDLFKLEIVARGSMDQHHIVFTICDSRSSTFNPSNHGHFLRSFIRLAEALKIGIQSIDAQGDDLRRNHLGAFLRFFRQHRHLSTIRIHSRYGFEDLLALSDTDNPACMGTRITQMCRCTHCHRTRVASFAGLRTLQVVLYRTDEQTPFSSVSWFEVFVRWLEERKEVGLGLDTVILRPIRSKVDQADLSKLREVVTNVIVEDQC